MSAENLTSTEALGLLLKQVEEFAPIIATRIREAINEGHTVTEQAFNSPSEQQIERNAPYTVEEALNVALQVLRAYCVEVPSFINSAHQEFAQTSTAIPIGRKIGGVDFSSQGSDEVKAKDAGEHKSIAVEQVIEASVLRTVVNDQNVEFSGIEIISSIKIEQQLRNFEELQGLLGSLKE